jgi:hypothetical protein
MTRVGLARARQQINRQQLSPATIDRMVSHFAPQEVDKRGASWDQYGKGRQAWDGWGGDPRSPLGHWRRPPDGCGGASSRALKQSTPPSLTPEPTNQPTPHRTNPGRHKRATNQQPKTGGTDAKKIENSPRKSRFKISSLQLLAEACRSPQKNPNSRGVFPLFPEAVQGASEIF